jgi:hypothetical protein
MSHMLEFRSPIEVILYFILSIPEIMHYVYYTPYGIVHRLYVCETVIYERDLTFFLLSTHGSVPLSNQLGYRQELSSILATKRRKAK